MYQNSHKEDAEAHVRGLHEQNPSWIREQAVKAIDMRVAICKPSLDELLWAASGDGQALAQFIQENRMDTFADPEEGLMQNLLFLKTCWQRLQQLLALAGEEPSRSSEEQTEGVSM